MAVDLYAGIPVSDYAPALAWYQRLLGSPPTFVASDTEAVWELAEHRSLVIEQLPEHAGHAMHVVFVDDFDALVTPDCQPGTGADQAGDLLQRRAQGHLSRSRRERDRVRRATLIGVTAPRAAVGVLAGDLVAPELEQVAAANLIRSPWVVVPVSGHSEQPRLPLTQWRSSP